MAYCEECGEVIRHRGQRCWETGGACRPEGGGGGGGDEAVTYKGKRYRLVWKGKTKYGKRAKLAFFDGSKEFWVDAGKLS